MNKIKIDMADIRIIAIISTIAYPNILAVLATRILLGETLQIFLIDISIKLFGQLNPNNYREKLKK